MSENSYVEIPNMPDSNCFACGPVNDKGLKMKFYGNDKLVYCDVSVPSYMVGWNGLAHGGIVSTLLDESMSWGAIFLTRRMIFTKTMTVTYHKPVMVGDMLHVESEVLEKISDRDAVMSSKIFNSKGELCSSATGSFFLMDIDRVKKLGIVDEKEVDEFWEMIKSFQEF